MTEDPEVTHCCLCLPVRCGFISLFVLTLISIISLGTNCYQLFHMGGLGALPYFSAALICCLLAEILCAYLQVQYVIVDSKETRELYLKSIHIGIICTITFWVFMMVFVARAMDILNGNLPSISKELN